MPNTFVLEAVADSALLLRFGDEISASTTLRVTAVADALRTARLADVTDVVPGYASVTVVFAEGGGRRIDALARQVHGIAAAATTTDGPRHSRLVEIPVAYGSDAGPDLDALARSLQLDADEIVRRHTAPDYTVAMVGFLPGFPYLLGLDPALVVARHATPRPRVPAGSVGIGGAQTGVYPVDSPGGWQLIGRTMVPLFDARYASPSLLEAGDTVRFRAVAASALPRESSLVVPRREPVPDTTVSNSATTKVRR
jgi:KipI family sensor histidine kinase inhibitor